MTDPLFEIKLLASLDHAQFEEQFGHLKLMETFLLYY